MNRQKLSRFALAVVLVTVGFYTLSAKTVYVDSKLAKSGDGKSWGTAVRTLAEGTDKCSDGDTMLVAGGTYDEGVKHFNKDWGDARLEFCNKHLYVKAVEGPTKTFIVGEKCTFTENADGSVSTNYVRCVQNYSGNDSVVEGFTLMNGDTGVHPTRNHNRKGSVVCSESNNTTWLVNCVITGNHGGYELLMGANLVHCVVTNNHITIDNGGQLFGNEVPCKVLNTLVYNNSCRKNGDLLYNGVAINSTFINNRFGAALNAPVIYNTVVSGSGSISPASSFGSATGTSDFPVMSSLTCDYRIRSGSAAETCGNGKYRTSEYWPSHPDGWVAESWRTHDLAGNVVSTEDTAIMAGCLQLTGTQATRVMEFTDSNYQYSLDGGLYSVGSRTYFISEVFPTQLVVRTQLAADERLIGMYVKNSPISRITTQFPEPGEDFLRFTPAADTTTTTPYQFGEAKVGKVVWTQPGLGDAAYAEADGSEEHPYETLQDALDNTTGKIVIQAKAGVYNKGGVADAGQQGRLSNFRLFVKGRTLRVIGVDGAENTVLMGAPDPDTLSEASMPGLGPKAYKCIGSSNAVYSVEGFTLTGGYSRHTRDGAVSYSLMGGALCSIDNSVLVQDCIITNNHAYTYSVAHYAMFNRCLIRDNHSVNNAMSSAIMSACVLGPNVMNDGAEANASSMLLNCTVTGAGHILVDSTSTIFNSVLADARSTYANICSGSVIWNVGTISGGTTGFIQQNPRLCGDDYGYGRLFKGSPALTAGIALTAAAAPAAALAYVHTDFEGTRVDYRAATQFAGAWKTTQDTGIYVEDATGLDGVTAGVNLLGSGDTIEVKPTRGYARPIVGINVNGTTIYFNDTEAGKIVYDAAAIAAGNTIINGILTANDWYVDAVNGNDTENDGYFAKNARQTLKAVLSDSRLKSGDRVLALPGTYNSETMQQANFGTRTVESRAVVPAGVILESTAGAATTIIEGKAGDTEDPKYYSAMSSMHGIGPGAIRCVYLNSNSQLKGFTLKNGHTRAYQGSEYNVHSDAEFTGGGTFVNGASIYNCVYEGCAAYRGGGTQGGTCYNCEFKNNFAIYGGGGAGGADFIQCLTHDNECYSHGARSGYFYGGRVLSSTIMDGIGDLSTTARCYQLTNSVFYGRFFVYNGHNDFTPANLRNCAFNSEAKSDRPSTATWTWDELDSSCVRVPANELQFDANYRPVIGANAAIDRGTPEVMNISSLAAYCAKDKDGGQRVYNGTVDMGCYEADWRPRYATDIAKRNLTVDSVDPAVVESDAGNVRLPAGTTLDASLSGVSSVARQVCVKVAGTGTLTVKLNDQVLGTQVGTGTANFEFKNTLAANQLKFEYTGDDGYAEILKVRYYSGLLILLQ